jgi:molybdopterin converting factor small subunit
MKITVLYFAQLKEAFGSDRDLLDVPAGATVDDVVASLRDRTEWSAVSSLPLRYAVNERIVDAGTKLGDGDRLALLTPISGG